MFKKLIDMMMGDRGGRREGRRRLMAREGRSKKRELASQSRLCHVTSKKSMWAGFIRWWA
jgi:hypothetical protein